ncbi:uncharacterized protein METZ01_LOCUS422593, partial [marine metagenome]
MACTLAYAGAGLMGCESGPVEGPLVTIGDKTIEPIDMQVYRAGLPDRLMPQDGGEAGIRELLQPLVDRTIMMVEAERLGHHEDPTFKARRHRLTSKELAQRLLGQVITGLEITEQEIVDAYEQSLWHREVLNAHILSATEADAREIIRLLDEGADFQELARSRSLAADAAEGGFLGQYFGPDDGALSLVEGAHHLPVGQYTRDPVQTRDGWEVVKILNDRRVPLESVRP